MKQAHTYLPPLPIQQRAPFTVLKLHDFTSLSPPHSKGGTYAAQQTTSPTEKLPLAATSEGTPHKEEFFLQKALKIERAPPHTKGNC